MAVAAKLFHEVSKHDLVLEFEHLKEGAYVLHDRVIKYQGNPPDISPIVDLVKEKTQDILRPNKLQFKLGLKTYVANNGDLGAGPRASTSGTSEVLRDVRPRGMLETPCATVSG